MMRHCTFHSHRILSKIDKNFRINPFRFIYYHRHVNSSMRYYAAEVDASSLPPLSREVKMPVEVSPAHDFTRRRDIKLNIPEYQLIVNLVSSVQVFQVSF